MLVIFVRYCKLVACGSLIPVDLIPLFVFQARVAPTLSVEWNGEVVDLM